MKISSIRPCVMVTYIDDQDNERTAVHTNARNVLNDFGLTNPKQITPERLKTIIDDYDLESYQMRVEILQCKFDYGIAYAAVLEKEKHEAKIKEDIANRGYCIHATYAVDATGLKYCCHCEQFIEE